MTILQRKLSQNAEAYHGLVWTHPTFVGGSETTKFVNVFSLKNLHYTVPYNNNNNADIDECTVGLDNCVVAPVDACVNTIGSFECMCPASYSGDGVEPASGGSGCTMI